MWTRNLLILACCLASSGAKAAFGGVPEGAEVIPAPSPISSPQMAMPMSDGTTCGVPGTPSTSPWYYWWDTWHWFDTCHDRGQHYTYLPPLPGWYYFRPYSVGQLRAQQEAVIQWGGDPRNPYCTGTLSQPREQARARATSTPSLTRRAAATSDQAAAPPQAAPGIIPWPPVLCDPRFAHERARIEDPFRHTLQGQGNPATEDYQGIVDAVEQMKSILRQITAEISVREGLSAERFLDQLAAEAREEAHVQVAFASSEPHSVAPAASQPDR